MCLVMGKRKRRRRAGEGGVLESWHEAMTSLRTDRGAAEARARSWRRRKRDLDRARHRDPLPARHHRRIMCPWLVTRPPARLLPLTAGLICSPMVIEPSTWYGAVVNSNTLMCSPREDTRNDMSLLSRPSPCSRGCRPSTNDGTSPHRGDHFA